MPLDGRAIHGRDLRKSGARTRCVAESRNKDSRIYGGGVRGIGLSIGTVARPQGPGKAPLLDFYVVARIDLAKAERDQNGRGVWSRPQHDSFADILAWNIAPVVFRG